METRPSHLWVSIFSFVNVARYLSTSLRESTTILPVQIYAFSMEKKTKNQKRRLKLKEAKQTKQEIKECESNPICVSAPTKNKPKISAIAQLIRARQAKQRADEEKKAQHEAQKAEEKKRETEQRLLETRLREEKRLARIEKRKMRKQALRKEGLLPLTPSQREQQKRNQIKLAQMKDMSMKVDIIPSPLTAEEKTDCDPILFRAPILCVLGHVDCGKTTLLDCIRGTNVQLKEAKGITQQMGATFIPGRSLPNSVQLQGLLIMDTPGHESFLNMRARGTSLCDMGILVIDVMHGLQKQTLECLQILREKKTPFVIALTKVDRLYEWQSRPNLSFDVCLQKQTQTTREQFEHQWIWIKVELAKQSINAELYYQNKDLRSVASVIPTSAQTGDGITDLLQSISELTEKRMGHCLEFREELECSVLEVKLLEGYSHTIDVILKNGTLRVGDRLVICGLGGAIVTKLRSILLPPSMKDQRVKTSYQMQKEIRGTASVTLVARGLESAVAGTAMYVIPNGDESPSPALLQKVQADLQTILSQVNRSGKGIYLQSSSLGSLEALIALLQNNQIPVHGMNIGPVAKRDVMRAATMVEIDPQYAALLAFDVKISPEAQEVAKEMKVAIFCSRVVFELVDLFVRHLTALKLKEKEFNANIAVFPVILKIIPDHVYHKSDPIILGVTVEEGTLIHGTPLCVCVEGKNHLLGRVGSMEKENQPVTEAKTGERISVKIEASPDQQQVMYGRHFSAEDLLYSSLTRESIDTLKQYFKDQMSDAGWRLVIRLKKILCIS